MVVSLLIKSVLLFVLGAIFATICTSFISAYHLYASKQTDMKDNIQFIEDRKTGAVFWNSYSTYKSALDAWYVAMFRRLFGSRKYISYHSKTRAKLLFMSSPVALLVILISAVLLAL